MMKNWQYTLVGILGGLLGAGVILLITRPMQGKPLEIPPAPTPEPITIDLSGAVTNPGVYALPVGSRVEDAILAAGGLLPEAFTESLNLAAPLYDGAKVLVPTVQEQPAASQANESSSSTAVQSTFPVNINTASLAQLEELPGIGESKAQAIIDYRSEHGPFLTPEDIIKVSGIGEATFESLKDLITIY